MTAYALTDVFIAVDEANVSGFANQLSLATSAVKLDRTNFASGGFEESRTGLATFGLSVSGFQSYSPATPDVLSSPAGLGGLDTFTVSVPGSAVGNVAYFGQCRSTSIDPLGGAVGDMASFSAGFVGTGRLARGVMLHPSAARTATGNGTVVAMTGPTATQALYAAFHVHSVTGTGTITFVIESDDAVGMASPTTRITSSAFAAIGHQFTSVAGSFSSETHVRVRWTIAGFTSVTFSVAAGVGAL